MRITIFTSGTRGDMQPYVALGVGLRRAGHQVRMPAPEVFQQLITTAGLEFVPTRLGNPQDLLRRPEAQASKSRIHSLIGNLKFLRLIQQVLVEAQDEYWRASANADLLIASTLMFGILDCAEQRGVPCVYAPLLPLEPTRAHPSALLAPWGVRLNHPLNLLTHQVIRLGIWELLRPSINCWRRRQALPPHSRLGYYRWQQAHTRLTLFGFSPAVLPRPTDWPVGHHVTGYWFLDEPPGWQPPADLVHFLESGPPPVYIGFGSMGDRNSNHRTQVCLEALRLSGQRGVLLSGWGGLDNIAASRNVYTADSIPHSWLFPRMVACVHHGGAGTTAAALRAGIPQVIVPRGADQPFWAERMTQLGVGERCASVAQLTAKQLAVAITRATTDPVRRQHATELGARIRAEDGVGLTVQLIDRTLRQ